MKSWEAARMRSALFAGVMALIAAFGCSAPSRDGEEEMPALRRAAFTLVARSGGFEVHEYTDGLRRRRDLLLHGRRYVTVTDLRKGERVGWRADAPSATMKREPMRTARPDAQFFWEGRKTAKRLGACHAAGEDGVLWSRPAFDYVPARTVCLSTDGVILRTTSGEKTSFEAEKIVREPIPERVFQVPTQ